MLRKIHSIEAHCKRLKVNRGRLLRVKSDRYLIENLNEVPLLLAGATLRITGELEALVRVIYDKYSFSYHAEVLHDKISRPIRRSTILSRQLTNTEQFDNKFEYL